MIVIDAIKAGGDPGTVYKCKSEDLLPKDEDPISLHEIGLLETLNMAKKMEMEIETLIIGVKPKIMDWGMELAEEVKHRVPSIIEVGLEEV